MAYPIYSHLYFNGRFFSFGGIGSGVWVGFFFDEGRRD